VLTSQLIACCHGQQGLKACFAGHTLSLQHFEVTITISVLAAMLLPEQVYVEAFTSHVSAIQCTVKMEKVGPSVFKT